MTVGDMLPSGYRFESIPDGISVRTRGQGRVDLFVNHETSKVPFPYVTADADRGERRERLRQRAGEPADAQPALGRRAQRLVRHPEQRRLPALLLELPRDARRRGSTATSSSRTRSRPTTCSGRRPRGRPPIGDPAEREAGVVVALDVKTGKHHPIYGMGRHNHENGVAIPGYDEPVVLSGDDTFTSGPLTGVPDTAGSSRARRSRSSTRTSRRAPTRCWPTRATSGRSSPTRRA